MIYKAYLQNAQAISVDAASGIYSALTEIVKRENDKDLTELYQDFLNACLRYAKIRTEWATFSTDKKAENGESRTLAHDRLIDCHNILYRYMIRKNINTEWYTTLGYSDMDKMTRKRIGDFACYVSLFLGLESR